MHLLLDVSGHGFGHLAQAGNIVRALRERVPDLRLTLRCDLPFPAVARFAGEPLTHLRETLDVGFVMADGLRVRREATVRAYRDFHADWEGRVDRAAARMGELRPDLLLADVPYLSLAAAQRLGVPSMAVCSLNWADILAGYASGPQIDDIREQMLEAYRGADLFVRTVPHMPMTDLPNAVSVAPLTRVGRSRRPELNRRLGLDGHERLVLVSLGGTPTELDLRQWADSGSLRALITAGTLARGPVLRAEDSGLTVPELLASCDAAVIKIGYNLVVESAVAGRPVLYLRRGDWPEEPYLVDWLHRHARAEEVSLEQISGGDLAPMLDRLSRRPSPPTPLATGGDEIAELALGLADPG